MKFALLAATVALAVYQASASLDAKIKARGKEYFGNVIDYNTIKDVAVTDILKKEFSVIAPENSWKWDFVQPARGVYNWTLSDNVAAWAVSNGKLIRGHTLVWHSQLSAWVWRIQDPSILTEVITDHITQVAGRYRGKVVAWDVVNEVVSDIGTLRNTIFSQLLGEEFIDLAFKVAKSVDPAAKLYINDYNIDKPGPKIDFFIGLIERLKARGVPVDGIGTQSHLTSGSLDDYEGQLARLGNTGLEVAISELDIKINATLPIDAADLEQQKADYATVTTACLNVPQCVGITLWGVSDKDSWVQYGEYTKFDLPLLWDRSVKPKPVYDAVVAALEA